jgi:hypothetical protein
LVGNFGQHLCTSTVDINFGHNCVQQLYPSTMVGNFG